MNFLPIFVVITLTILNPVYSQSDNRRFTLNEFFDGTFTAKSWNGTWISDDTFVYGNNGDYFSLNVLGKPKKILDKNLLTGYNGSSVLFTKDLQFVLIRYNVISVFRHSTTAQYAVIDLSSGQFHDLHDKNHLQLVVLSPDGTSLAYVFQNNIFYVNNLKGPYRPKQLTSAGQSETLYFGVPDWVYEEEVFGTGQALWFSPDSKSLAYAIFNDTKVPRFSYTIYGQPGSLQDQYPQQAIINYPKAGQNNPLVSVVLQKLSEEGTTKLNLPEEAQDPQNDFILYDLTWLNGQEVALITSNRVQNEVKLLKCSFNSECLVESHSKELKGWLDPIMPKFHSKNSSRKVEIAPKEVADDRFDHLMLDGQFVSDGRRMVTNIFGWDEKNSLIYYGGTIEDQPSQQHVFVFNEVTQKDHCLSCDLKCKSMTADFSKDFNYVTWICRGPNPTSVEIQGLNGSNLRFVWENNEEVLEKLQGKDLPVQENLRVPVGNGFEARVRLLLPPKLDKSKKYPLVVNVYAGPNSNQINDVYSAGFQNYIVTNREYIYCFIDGRGSGRDGKNKLYQIYRRLGSVEIEDQLTVIEYLKKNLSFVDGAKIGIWGWSYGGFASAWALAKDHKSLLKFALSVAPVTNFLYYDTIYTERYMGLPTKEDNELGYNNTDLTRNVQSFQVNDHRFYMLIHGNADDNVHYQNAMLLAKALEQSDIPFKQQSYPDENHSLAHVTRHLYHAIDQFWKESFLN